MFTSPLVESRLTEIRLEEVTPSVMETVIQFVYTGEAGLSLDTAEDLFVAANRLQVMPLQDLCSRCVCCDQVYSFIHDTSHFSWLYFYPLSYSPLVVSPLLLFLQISI